MKFLLFFLLLLQQTTVSAQYYRVARWDNGNKHIEVSGSGGNDSIYTEWSEGAGKRQAEGKYMYGKMTGAWQYWYEEGQKQLVMYFDSLDVASYKNEKIAGKLIKTVKYTQAGEVEAVEQYIDGKKSCFSTYYPNIKIKEFTIFDDNGRALTATEWYENGAVRSLARYTDDYKKGTKNGKETYTLESSKVIYQQWFDTGQIEIDGHVNDKGKKIGAWRTYDRDGNKLKTDEF